MAGVVLAAGQGSRLRPLSLERPKPLCPVANTALVDFAIDKLTAVVENVAVNTCHGREQMLEHLRPLAVHCAVEPVARGTAGALCGLRRWLDGRAALVVNGDTWCPVDLRPFVADWDGERVRVLILGDEAFGPRSRIIASITPWPHIVDLPTTPSGLWEQVWRDQLALGAVDVVGHDGPFVDCATPSDYLEANRRALHRSADLDTTGSLIAPSAAISPTAQVSTSVVGEGAMVAGWVTDSVIWPGAVVGQHERLDKSIRTAAGTTVLIR